MPLSKLSRNYGEVGMTENSVKHVILTLDNVAVPIVDRQTGREIVLPFSRADEILSEYYTKGYSLKYVQSMTPPMYADGTKQAMKLLYVLAK